ncbi:hypothetical protein FRAHR75_40046 [Frankia sp. Hr75.2]|nr:hypothetical protein FRAHR75_40046 [Frankia sp. Hr75.2]
MDSDGSCAWSRQALPDPQPMRGLWWAVGFGVSWVGMGADVAPTARTIFMRPRRAGDASRPHRGCASAWMGAGAHSVPSWRRVLRWAPRVHDSFVCLFGHYASRVSLGVRMALSVPGGIGRHRVSGGTGRGAPSRVNGACPDRYLIVPGECGPPGARRSGGSGAALRGRGRSADRRAMRRHGVETQGERSHGENSAMCGRGSQPGTHGLRGA